MYKRTTQSNSGVWKRHDLVTFCVCVYHYTNTGIIKPTNIPVTTIIFHVGRTKLCVLFYSIDLYTFLGLCTQIVHYK